MIIELIKLEATYRGLFLKSLENPSSRVHANAVLHQHRFMTSKPRQNRCGLQMFTQTRFHQKIKVVMV